MRLLASALVMSVWAQQGPASFSTRADLVPVYVTVTGRNGQRVGNLQSQDFEIRDGGKIRPILEFSSDRQPISLALVLDSSGSMFPHRSRVVAAAEDLISALGPDDQASIGTLTERVVPLTSDKARLLDGIRKGWPGDLNSLVWDGLARALQSFSPAANHRAVVIVTDGRDSGRLLPAISATSKTVLDAARQDSVLIYAAGLAGVPVDRTIQDAAVESGGGFGVLGTDGAGLLRDVIETLHGQYLLAFAPAALDGRSHPIEVRVNRPNVTVRARRSYVAHR